jgi:alcohol dehydrogenase (quinone), cytochrome c subunit
MNSFLRLLLIAATVLVLAFLAFLYVPVQRTPAQTALAADYAVPEGAGAYTMRMADCAACHTAEGGQPFVGGRAIISPVGTIYSSNITPDPETGIGRYSLDDFRAALYDGVRPDGSHLYPAMPYENYRKLTEQDIRALYGYFQNEVPPAKALRPPNSLGFPFNLSWGLRAWKWVALGDPGFTASSSDAVLARGQYLVEGPGHCGACHSPRNAVMAQAALTGADQAFLSGGQIAGWTAPPLRGTDSAIQGWTGDDITLILATARNAHSAINGEMQLVVRDSSQYMTDGDLTAIAVYLTSLNQGAAALVAEGQTDTEKLLISATPSMDLGPRLYLDNCAACHFSNGRGADEVFPELDGSSLVTAKSPTGLISMILQGGELPSTAARPERLRMPGFADRLRDDEVATLATFLRQAWSNKAGSVTTADVSDLRKSAPVN